jgi:hypothetical protein
MTRSTEPGEQLVDLERLDQVVLRPRVQTFDPVGERPPPR